MIDINLVPENLRKKRKNKEWETPKISLPKETIAGLVVGVFFLLLFLHVGLQFFIVLKYVQHKNLKEQQTQFAQDKVEAENTLKKLRKMQNAMKSVEEVTKFKKILWAQKLNIISDSILRGVWLERLNFDGTQLNIKGKAVFKKRNEGAQYKFHANLKKENSFNADFKTIEMGPINTKEIGNLTVTEFMIMAVVK